jgi:5-methyltetrahydropteroyltriglutamate--homocysteine methyltransferase
LAAIRSTHVGSLIRPPELHPFLRAIEHGRDYDRKAYEELLRSSVADVVRRQIEAGIDIVSDGEFGKATWITYLYERISGLEARPLPPEGTMLPPSRDRINFPGASA